MKTEDQRKGCGSLLFKKIKTQWIPLKPKFPHLNSRYQWRKIRSLRCGSIPSAITATKKCSFRCLPQ